MGAQQVRTVTVALTRYGESDELLREVLAAACGQVGVAGEVLLLDQRTDAQIDEFAFASAPLPLRVLRMSVSGLSAARNRLLDEARHDTILFLDADAIPAPDWAAKLAEALEQADIAVAGSRIVPRWTGKEPWFARARVVRDQYSLFELGTGLLSYPRAVGAGFGVDRAKTRDLRFDANLGRREGRLFGGEESDFCHRASKLGYGMVYQGGAVVEHVIAPGRMRLGWILKRLFYAGHGRALIGGTPSPSRTPGLADWLTLPLTLPTYALGWLWGKTVGPGSDAG